MFNSNNYVFKKHGDQYDVHQTGINDPQVIKMVNDYKMVRERLLTESSES